VRSRLILTILVLAVVAFATLAPAASGSGLTAAQLKAKLHSVKQHLRHARQRSHQAAADLAGGLQLQAQLAGGLGATIPPAIVTPPSMDPAVAARLLADGVVSDAEIAGLKARAAHAKALVRPWTVRARLFAKRVHRLEQIATWARTHQWRPLIEIAARKYGVNPAGLYHMMILESGGQPTVVSGPYHGLYQYTTSEWARTWNPWRHQSIFDGWAQIRATALALSKGMGPGQWPNTYPMSF
jgi:soluble lytic murein transglycosylase-like protein